VATLEAASEYGRRELYPLQRAWMRRNGGPAAAFAKLGTDGYLGVTVPEQYGGVGADLFTSGLAAGLLPLEPCAAFL
jgi:alkylation response protein AidB-like acyl-CoA dehydrogenase